MLARKYRAATPLYVLVVSSMIPVLLYLVISRLRLPLLAAVIPFAALALVETARVLLKGEWGRAAALIGAACALAFVLFRPLPTGLQIIRPTDYMVPYLVMYGPEEEAARAKGDHRRVAEIIREVLRRDRKSIGKVRAAGDLPRSHVDTLLYRPPLPTFPGPQRDRQHGRGGRPGNHSRTSPTLRPLADPGARSQGSTFTTKLFFTQKAGGVNRVKSGV